MTRTRRYSRLLERQQSRSRESNRLPDQSGAQSSHSRQNLSRTPTLSISPQCSSQSVEGHESSRIWQRSPSPAPRKLGDTSFRYRELDKRSNIRLLRILPKTTSIVKCELFHASLDDHFPYIAISYAWGDSDDTETIMIDGHNFVVTESLRLALERLRSKDTSVLVWADAICINQGNTEERNMQVQSMTKIYQTAAEVSIWLGPEADGSDMALMLMSNLYHYRNFSAQIRAIIGSPDSKPSFHALVALFDRDYWGRLWVVQEVINGSNVKVYCGNRSLPWDTFLKVSDLLSKYRPELTIAFLYVTGIAAVTATGRTYPGQLAAGGPAGLHDLRKKGGLAGLLQVLLYHQEKCCSEPRDRVYALLGILSPSESSQFPINYSRPVREVYIEVVDYLLNTTRSLDVICASINFPIQQNLHGLPSWCPDWSQRRRILPIFHAFPRFSASKASEPEFTFPKSSKRRTLIISAIVLGKITTFGVPLSPPICKSALLMSFFEWRLKLIEFKGYNQADHEAFCRTISCGQVPDALTPIEWLEQTYRTFSCSLRGRIPELILDAHLMHYVQNFAPISLAEQKQTLTEKFENAMPGRCFAITQTGLLCLGSGASQIEDLVCVPLGCSTPIILRKRGDGYTFIGDAYVDGYMHGRAIDEWRAGTREVERFELR